MAFATPGWGVKTTPSQKLRRRMLRPLQPLKRSSPFSRPGFGVPKPTGFAAMASPYGTAPKPAMPAPAKPAPGSLIPTTTKGTPPMPIDPVYDEDIAGLARRRDTAIGGYAAQRQQGLLDYGYKENPNTGALAYDPTNAFAKAAQLKRSYDQSRRRTGNQMASGGQLYAGAYQTGQDIVNRGQLQSEDALQKSLAGFLSGNTSAAARAREDYSTGVNDAAARRLDRLPNNPNYDPTSDAATVAEAKATVKPPSKPAAGGGGKGGKGPSKSKPKGAGRHHGRAKPSKRAPNRASGAGTLRPHKHRGKR